MDQPPKFFIFNPCVITKAGRKASQNFFCNHLTWKKGGKEKKAKTKSLDISELLII